MAKSATGAQRPRAACVGHCGRKWLNNELRDNDHNSCNERERARTQRNVDDKAGHGTLPIHKAPSRAAAAQATPVTWRKGDGRLSKIGTGARFASQSAASKRKSPGDSWLYSGALSRPLGPARRSLRPDNGLAGAIVPGSLKQRAPRLGNRDAASGIDQD